MNESTETLDRIFYEASQVDMTNPANKAWIAKRALVVIKQLAVDDQVTYVRQLCQVCHVDPVQMSAFMLMRP